MAINMMEHKTVSLADQVFEHLETDILSGKYQKGEVLTEMKLTAELGVSRTPVREALRRLQAEHIIEESAKGMVVMGISKQDLEDIFEIRAHLEGMINGFRLCRNCAQHIIDNRVTGRCGQSLIQT